MLVEITVIPYILFILFNEATVITVSCILRYDVTVIINCEGKKQIEQCKNNKRICKNENKDEKN